MEHLVGCPSRCATPRPISDVDVYPRATGIWEGSMTGTSVVRRVWAPTLLTTVTSTAIALVVIYATDWKKNPWAWVAIGILALLSFCGSLWLSQRQLSAEPVHGTRIGGGAKIIAKNNSIAAWMMRDASIGHRISKSQRAGLDSSSPKIEITGDVNIEADHGSLAAWSADNVTMEIPGKVDPSPPGR